MRNLSRYLRRLLGTDQIASALREISDQLHHLEKRLMASLDETLAAVTDESTKDDSIIALLAGIKAQLDAVLAGELPPAAQAKVDQIFAQATANSTKISDAITANTPGSASYARMVDPIT